MSERGAAPRRRGPAVVLSRATAAASRKPSTASASRSRAARRWGSSANPAAARASPRSPSCACCRKSGTRVSGLVCASRDATLLDLPERQMRDLRGNRLAMIFQEPMTSLNPGFTVGDQIGEALVAPSRA